MLLIVKISKWNGEKGAILKTTNGGNKWKELSSGTNDDLFSIYFSNENTPKCLWVNLCL